MNTIYSLVVSYGGITDSVVANVVSGMILFMGATLAIGCFAWFLNRVFSL